jgi:O-antigen/teichoic acid export membrane protein
VKQKDFIFNIVLLIFLNLLIKPFWILGIDVGVQNSVGAESYGLYFAVFNFTYLFNMLLDMGITNFNNRNIARHQQLLHKHLSGIITLKLLLGVVYMAVVFVVALIIGYRGLQLWFLFWMAINQFLNAFILYLRSNISALLMFKTDSCLSVMDRLLMIIFCGILLWGGVTNEPFRIEWFIYCQTVAYVLTALTALAIVVTKGRVTRLSWNPTFFLMILKKSLPFAILFLLMSFYNRIDSVMLERLLPEGVGASEAGIYASAFRLLDALVMIAYLFSVILLPLFSKMLKNNENITPIVKSSFSLLFLFSVTSVVLLECFRLPVMDLLYKEHVEESSAVFRFLIAGIIPISFTYIFGTMLTANGNLKLLNITAIAGIVVNMAVNLILIPRMQAEGAAIASLSTQSVVAVLQVVIAFRQLKVPVNSLPLWQSLLFTVVLVTAVWFFSQHFNGHVLWALLISGVFALLLGFATRLLTFDFVKQVRE